MNLFVIPLQNKTVFITKLITLSDRHSQNKAQSMLSLCRPYIWVFKMLRCHSHLWTTTATSAALVISWAPPALTGKSIQLVKSRWAVKIMLVYDDMLYKTIAFCECPQKPQRLICCSSWVQGRCSIKLQTQVNTQQFCFARAAFESSNL